MTDLHCSFCGKSQHQVAVLIIGPQVAICDECVGHCAEIVAVKAAKASPPAPTSNGSNAA